MKKMTADLLSTKEAAVYLSLCPSTLEKWRCRGEGPAYLKLGTRTVRYRITALEAFKSGGEHVR